MQPASLSLTFTENDSAELYDPLHITGPFGDKSFQALKCLNIIYFPLLSGAK